MQIPNSVYQRHLISSVYHKILNTQENVYKTFYNGYDMVNTPQNKGYD